MMSNECTCGACGTLPGGLGYWWCGMTPEEEAEMMEQMEADKQ
jgi:hypothetical protein